MATQMKTQFFLDSIESASGDVITVETFRRGTRNKATGEYTFSTENDVSFVKSNNPDYPLVEVLGSTADGKVHVFLNSRTVEVEVVEE